MIRFHYKIVLNFSRFKPALNWNRFLADLSRGSNSLNSDTGDVTFSDPSLKSDVFESQRYPWNMWLLKVPIGNLNFHTVLPFTCRIWYGLHDCFQTGLKMSVLQLLEILLNYSTLRTWSIIQNRSNQVRFLNS